MSIPTFIYPEPKPFAVRDCALITMAFGLKAQNLRELRSCLERIPAASIYHHFWGRLLRAQFDEPEYNNDFASWAFWGLHDKTLAERLSMVIPSDYSTLEDLRQEVIDVIEESLDALEVIPWSKADQQFNFLHSQIVVFDTRMRFESPEELVPFLPSLSTSSIYYHFIDARIRTPDAGDDFSNWLSCFGEKYMPLAHRLRTVDPYFSSLNEIRAVVTAIFQAFFEKGVSSES